jgi:holin-like protein
MDVLRGFTLLLLCQSAGEVIARLAGLGLPGPVLGLLLLLALLRIERVREPVAAAAGVLLQHLSLLFVPVGVGVMTHLDLLERYGLRLVAVLLLSTWIGLAVTALVLKRLWPREPGPGGAPADAQAATATDPATP